MNDPVLMGIIQGSSQPVKVMQDFREGQSALSHQEVTQGSAPCSEAMPAASRSTAW